MKDTTQKPVMKKVTMNLPADLVEDAPKYLGKSSLTEAVREALQEAMHRQACKQLIEMRGKIEFGMTWQEMKALRD